MQLPLPAYYVPRGVIEIKSQPETRSLLGEACRSRVGVKDDAEAENHRRATLESAKKKNTISEARSQGWCSSSAAMDGGAQQD